MGGLIMATFQFAITVTVERVTGKFAARDDIAEAIADALEGADPGTLDGLGADGATEYEVTDFTVDYLD